MNVRADLLYLWKTRHSSGFPWPHWPDWHTAVFGCPWYAAIPLHRKIARIPTRPYRYARMVRGIAYARNFPYAPHLEDAVS